MLRSWTGRLWFDFPQVVYRGTFAPLHHNSQRHLRVWQVAPSNTIGGAVVLPGGNRWFRNQATEARASRTEQTSISAAACSSPRHLGITQECATSDPDRIVTSSQSLSASSPCVDDPPPTTAAARFYTNLHEMGAASCVVDSLLAAVLRGWESASRHRRWRKIIVFV